ncbi:MAG: hypothetical protein IPN86_18270 [Saprospiraceae bacterium]|nr:hypothetical protein [Saprospiraceae bacterium]
MKQIITIILFSISFISAYAQKDDSHNYRTYLSTDINLGNYLGLDLNLNVVYKEKFSIKMGYTGNSRKALSTPDDFIKGFNNFFYPKDKLRDFHFGLGKIYSLNKTGARLNATISIGTAIIIEPKSWKKLDPVGWPFIFNDLGASNYDYLNKKYYEWSITLNPKIEFPFRRFYGITISPMVQISKTRTYYGLGIGQMIGEVKIKQK